MYSLQGFPDEGSDNMNIDFARKLELAYHQQCKALCDEFHLKQDEIAERVSKSRTAVTNSMRLLKLDSRVQQMMVDEMISSRRYTAYD